MGEGGRGSEGGSKVRKPCRDWALRGRVVPHAWDWERCGRRAGRRAGRQAQQDDNEESFFLLPSRSHSNVAQAASFPEIMAKGQAR